MSAPDRGPAGAALMVYLVALVAFGPVSTDMYLPSLPAMTEAFGVPVARVQLTLSVFLAGFAAGMLVHGPLSDRFGRRPVLLGGTALYVAGSLACLAAAGVESLIAGRFVQALGACTGPVVGRAVVRDLFERARAARVLSLMASAMALAPMLAPLLGGWLQAAFGWRSNFLVLTLFGVGVLVATAVLLRETLAAPDRDALAPRRMLRNYARLAGHRVFVGQSLCVAFAFAGLFSFISGSSFVFIQVLGVPPERFGLCFGAVVVGYVGGTFLSGRLGHRLGLERMVAAGAALTVVGGTVLVALALDGGSVAGVILPMIVFFFGCGLVLPNATAAAMAPFPGMAGAASALLGFLQMGTGGLAGYAVGRLHDGTVLPMAGTIAAMGVLTFLAWGLLGRPPSRPQAGPACSPRPGR